MTSKMWTNGGYSYLTELKKHCGKRRNCSLRAVSPFPHNVFKSCLMVMRQNEYLWSKSVIYIPFKTLSYLSHCLVLSRSSDRRILEKKKKNGKKRKVTINFSLSPATFSSCFFFTLLCTYPVIPSFMHVCIYFE